MFIPHLDERDIYDNNGRQMDDINTVAEYIDQVLLDHPDNIPEDEDDDSAQNFSADHIDYYCQQPYAVIDLTALPKILPQLFALRPAERMPDRYFEIVVPPPKVC